MEISDRIRLICKELHISVKQFETKCGLSNGYVNNIRKGISITSLDRILRNYPEIRRDWLVYEEGDMFYDNKSVFNDDPESYETTQTDTKIEDNRMLEIIKSQQNTIDRLTKIIENIVSK